MPVYSVGAYVELVGHLGVGEAVCHEFEDVYFPGAEACGVGFGWRGGIFLVCG